MDGLLVPLIVALALVLALICYTVLAARLRDRRDINEHSHRLAALEENLRHAPNHDDLSQIHDRVTAVSNAISQMQGTMDQINAGQALIHQHLLNKDKG